MSQGHGLTPDESVPLLTAWVMRLAADLGIRALVIKGPLVAQQGLREPRSSNDVDVWIDPDRHLEYCTELERLGWTRHVDSRHSVLRAHSLTMQHEFWRASWTCTSYFPGFFAEPQTAFDHTLGAPHVGSNRES